MLLNLIHIHMKTNTHGNNMLLHEILQGLGRWARETALFEHLVHGGCEVMGEVWGELAGVVRWPEALDVRVVVVVGKVVVAVVVVSLHPAEV
jgi:hypothetical protein